MDKALFDLVCLLAGAVTGLAVSRRWQSLLLGNWRGLFLLVPAIISSALPLGLYRLYPEWLWSLDRSLLVSLLLLRSLVWCLFFAVNLLPVRWLREYKRPGLKRPAGLGRWQKAAVVLIMAGLAGEAAVLYANAGFWPVSERLLLQSANPALAAGIRNQAYIFLRLIDPATRLPWLGQVWPFAWAARLGLSALPAISPAEAATATGLFFVGLLQCLTMNKTGSVRRMEKIQINQED